MKNTEYLKSPQQQKFWQILALSLHACSVLDQRWWGFETSHRIFSLTSLIFKCFTPVVLISQIAYVIMHSKTMPLNQIEDIFIMVLLTILVNVKTLSSRMKSYKKTMKEFMKEVHLFNYQINDFAKKKLISQETYTRWTLYALFVITYLIFTAMLSLPFYYYTINKEKIYNKTAKLTTSLYMMMPFDYEYNVKNWLIIHSINIYCVGVGCCLIAAFDATCYATIFHLIGHFEILKHKIKDFSETFDHLNEREVRNRIVDLIEYHSFVTRVFKSVQAAYGVNVTGNYLFNLLLDSFLLYEIMTREKVTGLLCCLIFFLIIGGLILMSVILEEIRKKSDGLADAVYSLPWEKMAVTNQKMIILILARVQPTVRFVGAGGMQTGFQTMLNIIKSTFSYYVMLKSKM